MLWMPLASVPFSGKNIWILFFYIMICANARKFSFLWRRKWNKSWLCDWVMQMFPELYRVWSTCLLFYYSRASTAILWIWTKTAKKMVEGEKPMNQGDYPTVWFERDVVNVCIEFTSQYTCWNYLVWSVARNSWQKLVNFNFTKWFFFVPREVCEHGWKVVLEDIVTQLYFFLMLWCILKTLEKNTILIICISHSILKLFQGS